MAAIAGIVRIDGAPAALGDTHAVMARMTHRSPDGAAYFEDVGFALAHGALRTTPESLGETQPMRFGERWVLAVDGRIDNREVLLAEFGIDAIDALRVADADLFAQAWGRWGEEFWRHIVGDFALAVWDRHARQLSLYRDRIGQRPLYYARSQHLTAFASEPEALLGLCGISHECHEDGLAYLLCSHFQPEDPGTTLYRDVRRLQPGERLLASSSGEVRVSRYWTMTPGPPMQLQDPREYVDAFREVFGEAVRCRLRSLHRPSLMLSGGIDSASILAVTRMPGNHAKSGALLPISVVADAGQACDETANILRMHGAGDGIRLPARGLVGSDIFQELRSAAWDQAHPIDNSILLPRLVYLAARRAGSNVMLDGADGDVVMQADNRYAAQLLLAGHPVRGLREAFQASRINTYQRGVSPARILAHGIASSVQPDWFAEWRYRVIDRRRGDEVLGPWVNRGFAKRLGLRQRSLAMAVADRRFKSHASPAEILARTWWSPGLTRSMEGADRSAACFGIEARHPWCDQRVVEFFLNLPVEYKARNGWTKWIARAAYENVLGETVAWHSGKDHLGPEVTKRLLAADKSRVSSFLAAAGERLRGVLDAGALARLQAKWPPNPNGVMDPDFDDVLHMATLAAWMDRFSLSAH